MQELLQSKTLTVSIACPPARVAEFVTNAENLPRWATAFCKSILQAGSHWIAETPDGPVEIEFIDHNALGVLDHRVRPAPGVEILVPMRVIPNGTGSEVLLTLFQFPGMPAEKFATDCQWVERDLHTLKQVLERST